MKVRLVDICKPKQWKTIPRNDLLDEGYPVYGANGIIGYYSEFNHEESVVTITCRGATCGSINITVPQSYVTGNAMCLDEVRSDIETEYLYYCLKHYDFNKIISGSAQPQITRQSMEKITISIFDHKKQIEILDKLKKIERIIAHRKQELSELDTLIKARFVEMFGDPVLNSFGWCRVSLSEVTSKIGSGATPKGGKESYRSEGISLIRSMNVHDGKFKYKDLAHITEKQAKQLNNVIVEENDVLVNITGASIARTCVVPKNVLPARVNQHVAIIRCDCEQVQPVFLNNLFLNIRFKKMLLSMGENGGATRQAITKQQLENIDVIVPPLSLQNEFAAFVQQIDKLRFGGRKRLTKAKNTKNNNRNTITLERSTLYGK